MSENYPFTGAGNLFRFCQGLAQIKVQNKIVVIFDNDAAGLEAQRKVKRLLLPSNMVVVRLPDILECRLFRTNGRTDLPKKTSTVERSPLSRSLISERARSLASGGLPTIPISICIRVN